MRNAIAFALVLAATPVAAQPVTSPAACTVTISRAPDDVRVVVEGWVKEEPRCASSVDVRIVPTEGGLYLLAQDEHGRVRERIVPDAQSAGVLVASWVADDTFPPEKTVVFVPSPAPPSAALRGEGLLAPGDTAPAIATAATTPSRVSKWISLGLLMDVEQGYGGGLRAEADVKTWGRWTAGIAASLTEVNNPLASGDVYGELFTRDIKAVATLSRTMQSGRWQLRASAGAGFVHTTATGFLQSSSHVYDFVEDAGLFPTAEASLVLAVELGTKWALHAGPVLSYYSQDYEAQEQYVWQPMTETLMRRDAEVLLYTGLRRRL